MIADEMKVDKVQTGKRIKKLMDEKGDTVLTLSQITGLSKSAIRNYINGKNRGKSGKKVCSNDLTSSGILCTAKSLPHM